VLTHRSITSYLLVVPLQRFSIQTDESTHTVLTCTSKEFKEFLGNQALVTDVLSDGGGAAHAYVRTEQATLWRHFLSLEELLALRARKGDA
jgi:hypothetical protein